LPEAIADFEQAIALKPDFVQAHYNLGNALRARGEFDRAAAAYQKALEFHPGYARAHLRLAHTRYQQGRPAEAITDYRSAFTIKAVYAIEDDLLGELRQEFKHRQAEAARYYTDDPDVLNPLPPNGRRERLFPVCAAVLAGCGQGEDAGRFNEQQRADFRQQALSWLRAYLQQLAGEVKTGDLEAGLRAREELRRWRLDPHLAGVRDPAGLDALPEAERQAWRKLWHEVDELLKPTPAP